MPSYPRLLSRLKDDDAEPCDVPPVKLIDVGCGFGQDLRKLVYDGVASERLIGLDIRNDFLELGYELFLDRATFTGKFIAANVFDHSVDSPVQSIQSQMDVVHAASFLHLFGWDEQIQACRGLSQLLKNEPGTMILGRHIGSRESGEYPHKTNPSGVTFSHDPTTFETMWRDVSRRTNTEWQVSATFENDLDPTNADKRNWKGGKFEWLYFEVTRL
ncbi:hypothetical protein MMC20_000306 [Loxospora ochrophaea]|nr:hypothetical protein [Loxospora ochrophaea]